jgi:hypothetical protein
MGTVSRVHTFASGAILTAAQLNNEFDNLLTSSAINGGLDATNLGVTAGQATASKALVVDASRNLADATGSNRINNLALSGTFESTGAITASAGITSGGNIVSDTDSTDDLGTTGVRWANLFVDDVTVTNNVTIGGTLTLTGGITLNGNTTIGDSSADTLTVNSTITSNLIFTDNTYDIGASGATRPRNLYLSGNGVVGGTLGVTGLITASGGVSGALTGNVTGNVTGNLTGDVTGNISGNVTGGTISGTTGTFSSTLGVTGATTLSSDVGIGTSATATNRLTLSGNQVILASGELKLADAANAQVGTIKNANSNGSQLDFITGGVTAMTINSAQDLAVDGDTLYIDASADRVGVNTSSPQLSVSTEVPLSGFDGFGVQYSNETKGELTVNPSTGEVRMGATNSTGTYFTTLYSNGSEAARIDLSGNVGIGTSSPSLQTWRTNTYLTIDNGTDGGVVELVTSASDASGNEAGAILWGARGNTTNHKHIGGIEMVTEGSTATQRGAYMRLLTKADGTAQPTERARILKDGGITFNGDTATANALDDYEEGTWTPVLARLTGSNYTFSRQDGFYTKIGNIVHVQFAITISAVTTQGSSFFLVSGLPFTAKNSTLQNGGGSATDQSAISGEPCTSIGVSPNATQILLFATGNPTINGGVLGETGANTANAIAGNFVGSITYEVD